MVEMLSWVVEVGEYEARPFILIGRYHSFFLDMVITIS